MAHRFIEIIKLLYFRFTKIRNVSQLSHAAPAAKFDPKLQPPVVKKNDKPSQPLNNNAAALLTVSFGSVFYNCVKS